MNTTKQNPVVTNTGQILNSKLTLPTTIKQKKNLHHNNLKSFYIYILAITYIF